MNLLVFIIWHKRLHTR